MIDGLMKDYIDPLWERLAQPLVRAGLTPNQVTAAGLVLILLTSGTYLWHRSELVFGLTLAVAFAFDALDGAVARKTGLSSKTGGYFDAMVDRYQELVVLLAIAWPTGLWALAMLGILTGPFVRRERWAWRTLAGSLAVWYVVDTAASLGTGFWQNAVNMDP